MSGSIGSGRRSRRTMAHGGAATLLLLAAAGHLALAGPGDDLDLAGRVVALDSRKPIAGAEVALGPSDKQGFPLKPESVATSDADGRFRLRLQPDREGERRPPLVVRVHHPGYVGRVSRPRAVAALRAEAARGAKPFFDTIELEPGEEYRATIVTPEAEPARGIGVTFYAGTGSNLSPHFSNDQLARSDDRGRVRVRLPKLAVITVSSSPEPFAPLVHNFNAMQDRKRYPGGTLPNDLGTLILERGEAISGRVLDLAGKPIPGFPVQAQSPETGATRQALAGDSGEFRLIGLRPGGYNIGPGRRKEGDGPRPEVAHPVGPRYVRVEARAGGTKVDVKEVPGVAVVARIVDSKGKAAPGKAIVSGQLAPDPKAARPRLTFKQIQDSLMGKEPEEEWGFPFAQAFFPWQVEFEADAEGRAAARVPKGLMNSNLYVRDDAGLTTYLVQARPGIDPSLYSYVPLGELKEDAPAIDFVAKRCATLTVRIVAEDGGKSPEAASVSAQLWKKGRSWGGVQAERGSDGAFLIVGMVPDQPYWIQAQAPGYLATRLEDVTLPEGGSRELTLSLSRTPEAAKVGDLAPPILVTTLDGRARSLPDYQGRFLLVTVWAARNTPAAMTPIKKIRDRYPEDKLALLGLSFDMDREALEESVKTRKVGWPQARLGGDFMRVQAIYGLNTFPCSILIGPDGTIVATNLRDAALDAALAKALKR